MLISGAAELFFEQEAEPAAVLLLQVAEGGVGLFHRRAHVHALAGGQPVELHHHLPAQLGGFGAGLVQLIGAELPRHGRGHPVAAHEVLAPHLGAFQRSPGPPGAEHRGYRNRQRSPSRPPPAGPSGPTTISLAPCASQKLLMAGKSVALISGWLLGMPALPGSTCTVAPSRVSFHAMACSRAPPPRSTRVLWLLLMDAWLSLIF